MKKVFIIIISILLCFNNLKAQEEKEVQHHRISFNIGWAYRFGKIQNPYDSQGKYRNGLNLNLSYSYFFNDFLGVGLNGNLSTLYNYKYTEKNDPLDPNTEWTLEKNAQIYYVAPMFATRFFYNKKKNSCFNANIGLGWIYYINVTRLNGSPSYANGNTLGYNASVGTDFYISKNISFGLNVSVILANLKKYKLKSDEKVSIINLPKGEYENLSQLLVTFVLSYNK